MRRVVLSVVAGLLVTSCGAQTEEERVAQPSIREVEREIKPELQKQTNRRLRSAGVSGKVRVRTVQCVKRGKTRARCFAALDGSTPEVGDDRVGIDVTIDPDDGSYLWEVDG